jgi:Flp pilus assembly protein TadD
LVDSDRPETHLNLGLHHLRRRDAGAAEAAYRTALRLDPAFVPALVNLADLERLRGREPESAALLRQALTLEPDNANARHALGLALVRRRDYVGALAALQRASELAPENARYAYVYAIALNGAGSRAEALRVLERVHREHPTDRDSLLALMAFAREAGDGGRALGFARELVRLDPINPEYRRIVTELQQRWPQLEAPPR